LPHQALGLCTFPRQGASTTAAVPHSIALQTAEKLLFSADLLGTHAGMQTTWRRAEHATWWRDLLKCDEGIS
jgi:hypothetical protein